MKTKKINQNEGRPQAWISVERNRQKIYTERGSEKVYLQDGQSFQIELFNPTQIRQLVKFKMNGIDQSERGLILNPGQRYFLDRFIDKNQKMVFSTYDVEKTEETLKAIEKNGILEVEFYPESQTPKVFNQTWTTWYPAYRNYPDLWNGYYPNYQTFPHEGNWTTGDSIMLNSTNYSTSSITSVDFNSSSESIETGRIERGENSNQKFKEGYGDFESFVSNKIVIQIVPLSQKPIESQEIRSYCTECGTRMKKQTWKFCPNCGNKI